MTTREEKNRALERLTEHIVPGRWNDARRPTDREFDATAVVEFAIEECSAKMRTGPPSDDDGDYGLSYWAGVIPLALTIGEPIQDERLRPGTPVPSYVSDYMSPRP